MQLWLRMQQSTHQYIQHKLSQAWFIPCLCMTLVKSQNWVRHNFTSLTATVPLSSPIQLMWQWALVFSLECIRISRYDLLSIRSLISPVHEQGPRRPWIRAKSVAYLKPSMLGARKHIPPWAASMLNNAPTRAQDYSVFLAFLISSLLLLCLLSYFFSISCSVVCITSCYCQSTEQITAFVALCWSPFDCHCHLPILWIDFSFSLSTLAPRPGGTPSLLFSPDIWYPIPCRTRSWSRFYSWMPSSWLQGGFYWPLSLLLERGRTVLELQTTLPRICCWWTRPLMVGRNPNVLLKYCSQC